MQFPSMVNILKLILSVFSLITVSYCNCPDSFQISPHKLLLISFDGFRWDYLQRKNTNLPHFENLISSGVKAKWIEDIFVTQTFPNHYTIVTGLYEESHGIVANKFYDPVLNKTFKMSSTEDEFWGGEPIWVTNQLHNHQSGVYFWVGSEAKEKNIHPTIYEPYDASVPWTDRVDTVVNWLVNGNEDGEINLALLYFNQPDHDGHKYGPESDEVTETIKRCDNITGYLVEQLKLYNLFSDINIIITSDHGMTELSQNRTVNIDKYVDQNDVFKIIDYGTGAGVWPSSNEADAIDKLYKSLKGIGNHVQVYKKDEIPDRYHYSNNVRIPPILLVPDDGWWINYNSSLQLNGSHGYDNDLLDMHPFFISHGPSFKQNYTSEPFSSVHIYSLMCHLLGFPPAPNNGSLQNIRHILNNDSINIPGICNGSEYVTKYILVIALCSVLMLIIFTVTLYKKVRSCKRDKELAVMLDDRVFSAAEDDLYLGYPDVELSPLVKSGPLKIYK